MRRFTSADGREWTILAQDVPIARVGNEIGWETILFDNAGVQRITHRPAGWLEKAGDADLEQALTESDVVRARWEGLTPAGS